MFKGKGEKKTKIRIEIIVDFFLFVFKMQALIAIVPDSIGICSLSIGFFFRTIVSIVHANPFGNQQCFSFWMNFSNNVATRNPRKRREKKLKIVKLLSVWTDFYFNCEMKMERIKKQEMLLLFRKIICYETKW